MLAHTDPPTWEDMFIGYVTCVGPLLKSSIFLCTKKKQLANILNMETYGICQNIS